MAALQWKIWQEEIHEPDHFEGVDVVFAVLLLPLFMHQIFQGSLCRLCCDLPTFLPVTSSLFDTQPQQAKLQPEDYMSKRYFCSIDATKFASAETPNVPPKVLNEGQCSPRNTMLLVYMLQQLL